MKGPLADDIRKASVYYMTRLHKLPMIIPVLMPRKLLTAYRIISLENIRGKNAPTASEKFPNGNGECV